jgi:hypothetical protein
LGRAGHIDPPSPSHLERLGLLNGIVQETMRVHSSGMTSSLEAARSSLTPYNIVGLNTRTALKDCSLPTGGGLTGTSPIGILVGTTLGKSSSLSMLLSKSKSILTSDMQQSWVSTACTVAPKFTAPMLMSSIRIAGTTTGRRAHGHSIRSIADRVYVWERTWL